MCHSLTPSRYGQPGNFTQTGTRRNIRSSCHPAPCQRSATTTRSNRGTALPGPQGPLILLLLLWLGAQVSPVAHAGYHLNTIEGRVVDECHLKMLRRGDVGYLPEAVEGGDQGLDLDPEEEELYAHPKSLVSPEY